MKNNILCTNQMYFGFNFLKTFDRIIIFIELKKYIWSQKFYIHKIDGHLNYYICKLKILHLNDKFNVKYCITDLIFYI